MTDKFTAFSGSIDADWLNGVDHAVYDSNGDPIGAFLPLSGSKPMTGNLELSGIAPLADSAVKRSYVDSKTAGAIVLLETQIITTPQADVEFITNFDSTYDHYYIEFSKLWPSVNATDIRMHVFANGSWQESGDYAVDGGALNNEILIFTNASDSPTGFGSGRGRVDIHMYDAAAASTASIDCVFTGSPSPGTLAKIEVSANYNTFESITGVRFRAATGNIEGEFRLYGIPK